MISASEFIKWLSVFNVPNGLSPVIPGYLPLAGGTMTGNLILNADATLPLQAVTFQQLNAVVSGLTPKAPCVLATTGALTGTYANGTSGVGATFTFTATGAQTIDGTATVLGERILMKDQVAQLQNGIYTVTTLGSVGVQEVWTRATDYDQSSEIVAGSYTIISGGTTNAGTMWYETTTGTIVVGTSPIVFTRSNYFTAGNGITITGNAISANINTTNLQFTSSAINTIQDIATTSSPQFAGLNLTGLTASQAVVTDASKNLASMAYSATGGTSNLVSRDSNGNTFSNNFTSATTSTAASGSPVNLNANAARLQITTGSGTQLYKLANATQLNLGSRYDFNDNATGIVTINDNSNTLLTTLLPGAYKSIFVTDISSPAGVWDWHSWVPRNVEWGTSTLTASSTNAQFNSLGVGVAASGTAGTISAATIILSNTPTIGYVWTCTNTSTGAGSWQPNSALGGVTSVEGTANQILPAIATTGDVTLSLANGVSIGSYVGTPAPAGGLIAPGAVSIGSSSPGTAQFLVNSLLAQGFTLQGTNSAASTQIGFYGTTKFLGSNPGVVAVSVYSNPVFSTSVGNTLTSASCFFSSPDYTGNLGAITVSYGYYHDGGNALPGGSLAAAYGAYFKVPVAGTVKNALYADNGAIGFSGVSPPTSGFLISGQTGLGLSGVDANSQTTATIANFRRAFYVGGTNTSAAGFDTYSSFFSVATWSPASGNSNFICDFVSNARFNAPSGGTLSGVLANFYASPILSGNLGTISNLFGFYFDGGSSAGGTVTTIYGGYFAAPVAGTNKVPLYSDGLSIGYTATTPPANSIIVSGGLIVRGTASNSSSTNFLQVGNSTLSSSNYIAVDASNSVDKGFQWYSAGTSRVFAIVPAGSPTIWQLTTGTQMIGVDLANARVMIGTGTALNKLDVNGAMAIGTYAANNTAAANSVILSGSLAIGTATNSNKVDIVQSGTGVTCVLRVHGGDNSSTSNIGRIWLENTAGGGGTIQAQFDSKYFSTPGNYGLEITPRVDAAGILSVPTGQVIFGSSTANVSANTSYQYIATSAYSSYFTGIQTAVDGSSNQAVIYVGSTLSPTNGGSIIAASYLAPILTAPSGKTITAAVGQYINCDVSTNVGTITSYIGQYIGLGTLTTAGTITSAYGCYISQPLASSTGNFYALSVQGGIVFKRTPTATDYTVKTGDTIIGVTNTGAARTITLPTTTPDSGWALIVKDETNAAGTNNITIARNGHNIDGVAANKTITTNSGVLRLYSDGTNLFTW